jgi:N-acetylglutamate synthase-like GNAT family acetyltransferase
MSIEYREVRFADVAHLASRAAKERVSISDTRGTTWFGAFDGELIGCGAVLIQSQKARLKASWIAPKYRGKGVGMGLLKTRILYAENNPAINRLEVFSIRPRIFLELGFKPFSVVREGVTALVKLL